MAQKDPLHQWLLKHAWQLLVALLAVAVAWANLRADVVANENRLNRIEEVVVDISENQQEIIRLQKDTQVNKEDIKEIKKDVKILLQRSN